MDVFEKITKQQGKERSAVWMVGEQLKDMIRNDPAGQEIVSQDLELQEMSLRNCEKKIKEFADGHKTGNFACVTPVEAEAIIREFYGLAEREETTTVAAGVVNLADFF